MGGHEIGGGGQCEQKNANKCSTATLTEPFYTETHFAWVSLIINIISIFINVLLEINIHHPASNWIPLLAPHCKHQPKFQYSSLTVLLYFFVFFFSISHADDQHYDAHRIAIQIFAHFCSVHMHFHSLFNLFGLAFNTSSHIFCFAHSNFDLNYSFVNNILCICRWNAIGFHQLFIADSQLSLLISLFICCFLFKIRLAYFFAATFHFILLYFEIFDGVFIPMFI